MSCASNPDAVLNRSVKINEETLAAPEMLPDVAPGLPANPTAAAGPAYVGLGSAVFHPESARIARLASGGRYGFAQSVFQVGGSFGTSMGPLLAALIVVPFGQTSIAWFSSIAFLAILILWRIGRWYRPRIATKKTAVAQA